MAEINLDKIYSSFLLALEESHDSESLSDLQKEYLGKNSVISEQRKNISNLSDLDKKKFGKIIKDVSEKINTDIENKKIVIKKDKYENKENSENVDISIDWLESTGTKEHVISSVMNEVVQIFSSIGYTVAHGPEAETSWHNFDALNTPVWHPARYESDTLYIDKKLDNLLRTQTSTVQVRHMQENKPPIYIVSPCLLYTSPSPRDRTRSRMPSSA